MKKLFAVLMSVVLVAAMLCGCQSSSEADVGTDAVSYKVGVLQYATHSSLDNCYQGLVEGFAEYGLVEGENLTVDLQNSNADMSTGDLQAKNMVTDGCDLIVGIATPSAMSAYAAARDEDIPVVFDAVSDPVAAGIVKSLEEPGVNCTGSSDVLNFDSQLTMIRAFLPDAKVIGVLYTTGEANSISQLARLEEAASNYGFTIESIGVTNSSEVAAAAASIVAKGVDCLTNLTDNNVVDCLSVVLHETNAAGIPVFGSEEEQVKNGCLASMSIDYVALGRESGRMAAQILLGEKTAAEMPVSTDSETFAIYNSTVAAELGIELPAEYADIQDAAAE